MSENRKPLGAEVPVKEALEMIERLKSQKEFSLPTNAAALTKGKEFAKAFISSGAETFDLCFGLDSRGEVCPVYLFKDESGNLLGAFNLDRFCPPFCEGD